MSRENSKERPAKGGSGQRGQTAEDLPEGLAVIGDIHGCLWHLEKMLDELRLQEVGAWTRRRRLVFLGDYGDRGPDTKGVIDKLIEIKKERPDTVFLMGNHDEMMLRSIQSEMAKSRGASIAGISAAPRRDPVRIWLRNGGWAALESYGGGRQVGLIESIDMIPAEHIKFLAKARGHFEWEDPETEESFFFAHAGADPSQPVRQSLTGANSKAILLWDRKAAERLPSGDEDLFPEWERTVVSGHTIQEEPRDRGKLILVDTGAFLDYRPDHEHGGALTAALLPERRFLSKSK